MIEDEDEADRHALPAPANDNDGPSAPGEDTRILRIAEAIGRKLARDYIKRMQAANDNRPGSRDGARPLKDS